jgi:hypothetical protein
MKPVPMTAAPIAAKLVIPLPIREPGLLQASGPIV